MGENVEGIEDQFRRWVGERKLDAKAGREGMEWILKEVGRPGSTRQRRRFKGRRLPLGPPELPEGYEVYVTRLGKVAYYRPEIQGRAASLDAYDREELAAALGPEDRGLADAIYEAIDRTAVVEPDW